MIKKEKAKEKTLLELKSSDIKDITLLDISHRIVISFSLLDETVPLLIKLEDIKYKDVRDEIKTSGESVPQMASVLYEDGMELIVNDFFNCIEWKVFDILDNDYCKDEVESIHNKYTFNGIKDWYNIDKELKLLKEKVIYNLKVFIIDKCLVDMDLQKEIIDIYLKIKDIRNKMIVEFKEILSKLLDFDDSKSISFTTYFSVMLKSSIVNATTPIFKENLGRAFTDYSFREIELKMSYELKESQLNNNRLTMMMPLMAQSSLF